MTGRADRRTRLLLPALVALAIGVVAHPGSAQIGGQPGAFSRLGFGARGMAMGNALSAVEGGELTGYYNPALLPSATSRGATAAFGILSLDRQLNFLGFTAPLPPRAGISIGLINAGVTDIDGRDSDGRQTGALRTSENQVFLGFGFAVSSWVQLGVTLKLFYYQLYTDVSSTTVGIDLGGLVRITPDLVAAITVRDINSRYKWDTSPLFGQSGQSSEDRFPLRTTAGIAYTLPDTLARVAAEVEISNVSTLHLRAGLEVPIIPEFAVRGGIDRVDIKDTGNGVRPAFGFAARTSPGTWTPAVHYTVVLEPFAPSPMHMIAVSVAF